MYMSYVFHTNTSSIELFHTNASYLFISISLTKKVRQNTEGNYMSIWVPPTKDKQTNKTKVQ